MAQPDFDVIHQYELEDGDMLLLAYENEKSPCFFEDALTSLNLIDTISSPEEEGGETTVYCGKINGKRLMARAGRLDKRFYPPKECMKQLVSSNIDISEKEGMKRVIVPISKEWRDPLLTAVCEGAVIGGYKFKKYLSKKKDLPKVLALVDSPLTKDEKKGLKSTSTLYNWVNLARDLLNEPPNSINPETLSNEMARLGKKAGLKTTVWDEKRLNKEGMNAILAVGSGGATPPRLVIGEYRPRGAKGHLVLVGKGITFDTGGYCLKPADAQLGMKYDMAGAVATFIAACAIADAGLKIRITVITPLAENAISHKAYKTSDIIRTKSGKSVQVDNTDAEGRLILADALTLALEKKPDWLIDCATLTGACVVALGEDIAGVMGQDRGLIKDILEAGKDQGETFWELPLHRPYSEELKAEVADIKNIGKRWGGAITGALFLKEFVPDDIPWLHLDIAGPGVKEEPLGHLSKGAKGFGVKTLFGLAKRLCKD